MEIPNGKAMQKKRESLGLTQLEAANEAGISKRTVQNIEACDPRVQLKNLLKYAEAIDFPLDQIYIDDPAASTGANGFQNDVSFGPQNANGSHNGHAGTKDAAGRDGFYDLPWSLFRPITERLVPGRTGFCQRMHQAEAAIRKMRDSWKKHLQRTRLMPPERQQVSADQWLNDHLDAYVTRYLMIWHRVRQSLLCSTVDGRHTGVSVVLRVTEQAYARFCAGQLPFMQLTYLDVLPQSQYLILDSAVEFDDAARGNWRSITDSLAFTVFYQTAVLSADASTETVRIASFGASPANSDRLRRSGFLENGFRTPEFDFPIFEFTSDNCDLPDETALKQATGLFYLQQFKNWLKKQKRNDDGRRNGRLQLKLRRRVTLTALRSYQKLLRGLDRRGSRAA